MMGKRQKLGISLIVLVITIIVIIIIAGAIILSLTNSDIIGKASLAKESNDFASIRQMIEMERSSDMFDDYSFNVSNIKIPANYSDEIEVIDKDTVIIKHATNPDIKNVDVAVEKLGAIYIPEGFEYLEGTIDKGLVIRHKTDYNEFVWIPVDGINVPYAKWCTTGTAYTHSSISDDSLPEGVELEINQINKYGGFYVGRFESGKENISTVVSKKGTEVWVSINYTAAKTNAESMYITQEIKSGLVTGTQWDTIMKWIQNSGKNTSESTGWGNHSNSISPANVSGSGAKQVAGYSEYWKANNIYDIAGGMWEFTNELSNTNCVRRSGRHSDSGITYPADYRSCSAGKDWTSTGTSFRVVLYIS